jgi:hypothetical protein
LPQEPRAIFGSLMSFCIREDSMDDRRFLAEGALFLILGAVSSVVTTYILSAAGLLL